MWRQSLSGASRRRLGTPILRSATSGSGFATSLRGSEPSQQPFLNKARRAMACDAWLR